MDVGWKWARWNTATFLDSALGGRQDSSRMQFSSTSNPLRSKFSAHTSLRFICVLYYVLFVCSSPAANGLQVENRTSEAILDANMWSLWHDSSSWLYPTDCTEGCWTPWCLKLCRIALLIFATETNLLILLYCIQIILANCTVFFFANFIVLLNCEIIFFSHFFVDEASCLGASIAAQLRHPLIRRALQHDSILLP